MKISATSSGGFAGLSEHYDIDTETSAAGRALEAMVADSGFFEDGAEPPPEPAGADLQRWRISIDDHGRQRTLSFVEDGAADNSRWQSLISHIRALAA
ncbi:MAG: protealysin inhibitor emfourin [Pseudomonadota bacterium]